MMSEQTSAAQQYADSVDKYLNEGTGRSQRNPRPGVGTFKVLLQGAKRIADTKKTPVMIDGVPKIAEVTTVTALILVLKVLESTCAANPVGSVMDVYFRRGPTPGKPFAEENDDKDVVDFVAAWYKSLGYAKIDRAMYDALVGPTAALDTCSGVILNLTTVVKKPSAKAREKAAAEGKTLTESADPFLYKNWSPVPQSIEDVAARRAEIRAATASK